LIAAHVGQGLEPAAAARAGVFLHGEAGDLAAAELGEVALIASDLIERLPAAMCRFAP
jgi:NAD(P)H-hydrate epimerase